MRTYRGQEVADSLPSFPRDRRRDDARSGWHEVGGHPGLEREIVPYSTDDDWTSNLHHLRRGPIAKGAQPVMLSHGAGLRAQLFYGQPSGTSLAERAARGGLRRVGPELARLDRLPGPRLHARRVARYDHPAAVETVLERSGASTLKAITHCQGSINFTAAAAVRACCPT